MDVYAAELAAMQSFLLFSYVNRDQERRLQPS